MTLIVFNEKFIRLKRILLFLLIPVFSFTTTKAQDCDTVSMQNESVADSSVSVAAQNDAFHNHVPVFEIKPVSSNRQPTWLFIVFVFQFALIGYVRVAFPKAFEDIFKAAMSLNIAQQLYREQEQSMPFSAIVYTVNFIISGGIFLFLLNRHLGWMQDDSVISMLFFLWAVIVIYSLKYGSMKLVSLVFPFGEAVDHYNFNFFLIQKIIGMGLVPFNLLMAYASESLTVVVIIIAVIMVVTLSVGISLKGLSIARNQISRNAFHFFVYICTLEIAPVCILVKVVVDG